MFTTAMAMLDLSTLSGLYLGKESAFNRWASENDLRPFPSSEPDLVGPAATDDREKRPCVLPLNS